MKIIVVTGGIGSGKSVACRFLSTEFGWPIYCADKKVKELYVKSPSLLKSIEESLKMSFRDRDGKFYPASLAAVIFSDSRALEIVEGLVFPELIEDFVLWQSEHKDAACVVLESATILEKPQLKGIGDVVLLIDAPLEVRLSRTVERDRTDADSVQRRMEVQGLMNDVSAGLVPPPADVVVMNDSSVEELYDRLRKFVENTV